MDLIKKLRELSASWERRADSRMSDSYADATYDCVNDLCELIDIASNQPLNGDHGKRGDCSKCERVLQDGDFPLS